MKCILAIRRAALAVVVFSAFASAEDKIYLGGAWNNAGNWSPTGIPTSVDRAVLDDAHVGTVFVAGGFDVDELYMNGGSTGYHMTGEGGTLGHALKINVDGDNTVLDIASVTGHPFNGGYALGLNGNGSIEWRTSIIDTANQPLDVYASGIFSRGNFNTGSTILHAYTKLIGGGAFNSTPDLVIDRASLEIHNVAGDPNPNNRIGDGTHITLNHAFWFTYNDAGFSTTEHIAGITLGVGHNRISSSGNDLYAPGSALVRDASQHGTLMLETAIGSTHVAPAGFGVGSYVVPWATRYGNLAFYDSGANNLPGDGDDGGFIDVPYTDLASTPVTGHGEVASGYTLPAAKTVRSLAVREGQTFNTGDNVLTLTDAALVLNNNATVTQNIAGRIQLQGGSESFLHVPSGNATVAARLTSANGLTKGGDGNLTLSGANNISGPIYFNNGMLELASVGALSASNDIHLVESSIKFNYGSGGTVSNHIVLNTGRSDPLYSGSFLDDWIVKDNTNWDFSGTIEGRGPYFLRGENSKITISGIHASTPGVASPGEDFSLWPQGNVNLEITGRLGDENNHGTLILFGGRTTGNGEVTGGIQVTNGGTLAPGLYNGAGIALFKTNELDMYDGRMEFQINGTARGTQYDAVDVGSLGVFGGGGTLAITGNATGQIGNRFDLVRFPSAFWFNGGPTFTNSVALQSGAQWVHWIDGDSLTVAVAGPTGDSNLDGRVNFDDLLIIAQNYGQLGNWTTGDFNNDGIVNFDDLLLVAQHYGQNALVGGDESLNFAADWKLAQSVAPEPTSLGLVAGGLFGMRRRRAR